MRHRLEVADGPAELAAVLGVAGGLGGGAKMGWGGGKGGGRGVATGRIWRRGGVWGRRKQVIPRRWSAPGLVRAYTVMTVSSTPAPLAKIFSPVRTNRSPRRSA